MTRELTVPELSLVVLIGVSGSGKSTFGRVHFRPTEVISSDFCRGLVPTMRTTSTPRRRRSSCCITSPASGSRPAG